jgi:chromosome segregation ATPase
MEEFFASRQTSLIHSYLFNANTHSAGIARDTLSEVRKRFKELNDFTIKCYQGGENLVDLGTQIQLQDATNDSLSLENNSLRIQLNTERQRLEAAEARLQSPNGRAHPTASTITDDAKKRYKEKYNKYRNKNAQLTHDNMQLQDAASDKDIDIRNLERMLATSDAEYDWLKDQHQMALDDLEKQKAQMLQLHELHQKAAQEFVDKELAYDTDVKEIQKELDASNKIKKKQGKQITNLLAEAKKLKKDLADLQEADEECATLVAEQKRAIEAGEKAIEDANTKANDDRLEWLYNIKDEMSKIVRTKIGTEARIERITKFFGNMSPEYESTDQGSDSHGWQVASMEALMHLIESIESDEPTKLGGCAKLFVSSDYEKFAAIAPNNAAPEAFGLLLKAQSLSLLQDLGG